MSPKRLKDFEPGHGFERKDWDEVSDTPELTDEEIAQAKPFSEVFPELATAIRRSRGRPRVENPKQAVTLRLSPTTIERFKAMGGDWRARMAKALEG